MEAERLIALEAALADVSGLYAVARRYVALRERAESELLPMLTNLGAELRSLRRRQQLDDEAAMQVVTRILGEAARWHEALAALHGSATYQEALAAWRSSDQSVLQHTIPLVLAGYRLVPTPPALAFPLSVTRRARRSGGSPFLGLAAYAEQIEDIITNGLCREDAGGAWWDSELQPLICAAAAADLGSSLALRKQRSPSAEHLPIPSLESMRPMQTTNTFKDPHDDALAVFAADDDSTLRVFVQKLCGPFTIVVAAQPEDEWWEAYESSYPEFCVNLKRTLEAHGHVVELESDR